MTIEQYCAELHTGQWFTFQDPETGKTGEKSLDTLRLTPMGEAQGYSLPTQAEFDAWVIEQEKQKTEQEVIEARRQAYGNQLERIIEDINSGSTPTQAFRKEANRVKQIKEDNPKPQ